MMYDCVPVRESIKQSLPSSGHQTIVAEHEIRNISCAAQDPDDLCTFAYITKDLKSGHHFCHVFSTVEVVSDLFQLT